MYLYLNIKIVFELGGNAYHVSPFPETRLSRQLGEHPSKFPPLQQMATCTALLGGLLKG